jgi:hypothetical protein
MSYDLYLTKDPPPPAAELAAYLGTQEHFELTSADQGFQAIYQNPATGVYFTLDHGWDAEEEDEGRPPPAPIVLSLALNFNRPAFFAYECFEVVRRICKELGMHVFVEFDEPPRAFDLDEHFASWEEGNSFAVTVFHEHGGEPPFMEREKALEWWRYARRKPEIDARFEAERYDVFVPTLMLMRDAQTNAVQRVVAWPDAIPIVVPPLDSFIVQRGVGGRFRRKTQQGIVDASTVLDAIGSLLEPLDDLDDDVRILTPEAAESPVVRDALAGLTLRELDKSRYQGVAPDEFVDVRISPRG